MAIPPVFLDEVECLRTYAQELREHPASLTAQVSAIHAGSRSQAQARTARRGGTRTYHVDHCAGSIMARMYPHKVCVGTQQTHVVAQYFLVVRRCPFARRAVAMESAFDRIEQVILPALQFCAQETRFQVRYKSMNATCVQLHRGRSDCNHRPSW